MKKVFCIAYVAVLMVMGAATFIEAAEGTPYVHKHVYGTWWFVALWAVLAIAGALYITRCKALWTEHRRRGVPCLLLHASFLIILAGALLTRLTARSGTIHLRMNEAQDIAEIEHCGERYRHRLNFKLQLTDFQVIEDGEGHAKDFRSEFRITQDGKSTWAVVSMNQIAKHGNIRFYQMSYDSDTRGSTLMINRDPYGIPVTYCGYALLFLSFIWLCLTKRRHSASARSRRDALPVAAATIVLTAAWCVYYFVLDGSWSRIPVLRHPLLVFHVTVIIVAYSLLLIQAIRSAWWLATKRDSGATASPGRSMRLALCLLSIGIFLGAIWANISWGNYWSWDSKETWALITLMIYAVPLHRHSLPAFSNPRTYHTYMLMAFLTVLMTYFGVNHLLTGMHSYT